MNAFIVILAILSFATTLFAPASAVENSVRGEGERRLGGLGLCAQMCSLMLSCRWKCNVGSCVEIIPKYFPDYSGSAAERAEFCRSSIDALGGCDNFGAPGTFEPQVGVSGGDPCWARNNLEQMLGGDASVGDCIQFFRSNNFICGRGD